MKLLQYTRRSDHVFFVQIVRARARCQLPTSNNSLSNQSRHLLEETDAGKQFAKGYANIMQDLDTFESIVAKRWKSVLRIG
jgi:hypothetical protein